MRLADKRTWCVYLGRSGGAAEIPGRFGGGPQGRIRTPNLALPHRPRTRPVDGQARSWGPAVKLTRKRPMLTFEAQRKRFGLGSPITVKMTAAAGDGSSF